MMTLIQHKKCVLLDFLFVCLPCKGVIVSCILVCEIAVVGSSCNQTDLSSKLVSANYWQGSLEKGKFFFLYLYFPIY